MNTIYGIIVQILNKTDHSPAKAVILSEDNKEYRYRITRFTYSHPKVDDRVVIRKEGSDIVIEKDARYTSDGTDDIDRIEPAESEISTGEGLAGFVFAVASFFGGILPAIIGVLICSSIADKRGNDKFANAGYKIAIIQLIIHFIIMLIIIFFLVKTGQSYKNIINSLDPRQYTQTEQGQYY